MLGHEVKLMPPAYVNPYVKRQKNDAADAEAICEAVQRPSMRLRAGFLCLVLEGEAVLMVPSRAHKARIRNERGGMDVVHGWHDVPQQRHLTRLSLTRRGDRQGKGEVVVGKPDGRGRRGSLCVPAPRGPHRLGRQRP